MPTETKDTLNNVFKQATENVQAVIDAGLRIQEQTFRFWAEPTALPGSFDDLRRRGEQWTTDAIAVLQKNAAEGQKVFDAQCRSSADLCRKAFETVAADGPENLRDRTADWWQNTFDAVRTTVEATAKSGVQMIENWSNFMSRALADNHRKPAAQK